MFSGSKRAVYLNPIDINIYFAFDAMFVLSEVRYIGEPRQANPRLLLE
jgi:hypothetical protein